MLKQLDLIKRFDELSKASKKVDAFRYLLLVLIGLGWSLYQILDEVDRYDTILFTTILGIFYLFNQKQTNSFVIALHNIVQKVESSASTISSLLNVQDKLNNKVKLDEEFRKEVSNKLHNVSDKLSDFMSTTKQPDSNDETIPGIRKGRM